MSLLSRLLFLVLLSFFANVAIAACDYQNSMNLIVDEEDADLEIQICDTLEGYNSKYFVMSWGKNPQVEVKRVQFIFLPGRNLPSHVKYVTVQNQRDELVSVTEDDKVVLLEALQWLDRSSQYYSVIEGITYLTANSANVDESYFERKNEINFYADDGVIWAAGWYTDGDRLNYVMSPVADQETLCLGRKGSRCGRPNYSREALNHDLCHRITGYQLHQCKDEFWQAAITFAEKSPEKVFF